jgi:YgiT-type zinc finger domain-containing protein
MVFPAKENMSMKKKAKKEDVCSFCNGRLLGKNLQKPCWWGKEMKLVVQNVPALVCTSCGEIYYSAQTLKILEKLLRKVLKKTVKKIPVMKFSDSTGFKGGM